MDPELTQFYRAMVGVCYAAFVKLQEGETEKAAVLMGTTVKMALAKTDIPLPPSPTQLDRLVEESVYYLEHHPLPMW